MRKEVCLVATIVAFAVLVSPAGAQITASQVTSPTNPTFVDPDLDAATQPLDVSGTTTGGGGGNIFCVYDNGNQSATGTTSLYTLDTLGGPFTRTIDLNEFDYYVCRLIVVPVGAMPPFDLGIFKGPVVGNAGHELDRVSGGPNDGQLYNYLQNSAAREGYWSGESGGDCFIRDSYPVEPGSLDFGAALFDCSSLLQGEPAAEPSLRVDSRNAYLPDEQTDFNPGFRQIEDLNHGIDPANGEMRVSSTEPAVSCVPADSACNSYSDTGIELEQTQTGGADGRTLAINHHWVNTTGSTKQLEVHYQVTLNDPTPGWRFPGESAYSAHTANDTITPPASGPGSFFVALAPGSSCPSHIDPCGSVTWYEPPQSIRFGGDYYVELGYERTIPPGGEAVIALTYSQGFPRGAVDGYAAEAESAFDTGFSFGKLKRNKKKGKATLAVQVPGEGELHLEGKGLKTVDTVAGSSPARAHARATTTVELLVKPKGKTKRKLKRKGKAKLIAEVTYARTDLEPTEATKKLKLKRKKKP